MAEEVVGVREESERESSRGAGVKPGGQQQQQQQQHQHHLLIKEEFPLEQLEWSVYVDQTEPEHRYIKEEDEEVCIEKEGVHNIAVCVKTEEEKSEDYKGPESTRTSDHHQLLVMRVWSEQRLSVSGVAQEDLEKCLMKEDQEVQVFVKSEKDADIRQYHGEPELVRNSSQDGHLRTKDETKDFCVTADSKQDCKESSEPTSSSGSREIRGNTGENRHSFTSKRQKRIRYGENSYSCSKCDKTYTQIGHLRRHERNHAAEKPFSCTECGKRFRHNCDLRVHERIHTGERPFGCQECGKRFTTRSHMTSHAKTHKGEKPFSCSECGERFKQKGVLHRHEKIHTGEKPFSCAECGKSFRRHCHLRRHVQSHTGVKPFYCSECGKRFTRVTALRTHNKKTHKGKTISL